MTTSELFGPMIFSGIFAIFGSYGTLTTTIVKGRAMPNSGKIDDEFKGQLPVKARYRYLSVYFITPLVIGSAYGLLVPGSFPEFVTQNERILYGGAVVIGVVSHTIVSKLNSVGHKELVRMFKDILGIK